MPEITESRFMVQAGWDDIPHLDEKTKRELLAGYSPHEREARTKGTPSLGAGAIYPIGDDEITCAPFAIPRYWPRAYGFDVGWNRTAALWGAYDRESLTLYCYTEHYRGQAEPSIHTSAIKARGDWIPGAIDPAARGRGQKDGEQLIADYRQLGLNLTNADNAVEAGLFDVWERMSTGRLKIFTTCMNTLAERRIYRRNEKGQVVKKNDHLMDALRYLVRTGIQIAETEPVKRSGHRYGGPADGIAGY